MRDRTIESFRIILTVIGLVLFVVYAGRATSASTDRKVSGIRHFAVVTGRENLADLMSPTARSVALQSSDMSAAASSKHVAKEPAVTASARLSARANMQHAGPARQQGNGVSAQAQKHKSKTHPPAIAELPNDAATQHQPL